MWRFALVMGTGCGRLGFDPLAAADTDSGPPPDFITSATPLTSASMHSWVDVDVDWSREMAYLSSRDSGTCFAAVDFSGPPVIVGRFGPAEMSGTSCLGVSLDPAGTQLLVASEGSDRVELWDLGTDPRAGTYTQIATASVSGPRRIARDFADPNRVYVARNSNAPGLQALQVTSAAPFLGSQTSFDSPRQCPDSGNDATSLANGLVLSGCATDSSPLEVVDGVSMSLVASIPATPAIQPSGFWSATRSPDGSIGVASGWIGVIVTAGGGAGFTLAARFDNDDSYRGIAFADRGAGPEIWAARSDGLIDAMSIATPSDPIVIGRGSLGVMGEAYAIRVDPSADRAVIVTNRGFFVIARPSAIGVISERWPPF